MPRGTTWLPHGRDLGQHQRRNEFVALCLDGENRGRCRRRRQALHTELEGGIAVGHAHPANDADFPRPGARTRAAPQQIADPHRLAVAAGPRECVAAGALIDQVPGRMVRVAWAPPLGRTGRGGDRGAPRRRADLAGAGLERLAVVGEEVYRIDAEATSAAGRSRRHSVPAAVPPSAPDRRGGWMRSFSGESVRGGSVSRRCMRLMREGSARNC